MEMDEVREGPISLEVYSKPALFNRAARPKHKVLSTKPLFLHLNLAIQRH